MGTFNVNGKMPSQDLSTWVQSRVSATPTFGNKDAGKEEGKGVFIIYPFVSFLPFYSCSDSTLAETQSLRTTESDTTAPTITTTDFDPDILALGFQEIDLSTEALLYSTSTTREDAWTLAIFAGLGEKGELYEKVRLCYL